ncbi:hypothetical protein ABZS88_19055 [Streptomyces sp. NPDC005480]|uniref:hypothetical protein n=1 Tax=Streptomyces sp. NPDC005480 TaxID=3154880 RepID=UPI0033B49466
MLRHNALRAVLVGATMTGLAAFGTASASATDAQATTDIPCHYDGSVCITVDTIYTMEATVVVPEGEDYTWLRPADITTISNDTTKTYCVHGDDLYPPMPVAPGQTVEEPLTVTSVTVSATEYCPV